jgi:hypothetical protein
MDGWLELYAPSRSRPQPRQQGRLALCLQRQPDGSRALAVFQAWLLDPEDNRLLLLVLP